MDAGHDFLPSTGDASCSCNGGWAGAAPKSDGEQSWFESPRVMSRPRNFQLLIKPVSADCNLGCRYCFYRRVAGMYPDSGAHRMPAEVLERMIGHYLGATRYSPAVFAWQGGEPLLAGLDFYVDAFGLMTRHGRGGQDVSNAVQTNGVLIDREWARLFAAYSVLVGVSLDGPREIHDHYRTGPGGGTFDAVMVGIRHLREARAEFNILTMITPHSAPRGAEIYRFLRGEGFRHLQFIPCVEADPRTGEPAAYTVSPLAFGDFMSAVFDAWRTDGSDEVSVRLFDAMMEREVRGRSSLCELDGPCSGYVVVEHNGDVYPCDFFVRPEWRMGNLMRDDFDALFASSQWRDFGAQREANAGACVGCEWLDLCRGGCNKDRLLAGGVEHRTYLCEGYRRFFAHAGEELRRLARERCPT